MTFRIRSARSAFVVAVLALVAGVVVAVSQPAHAAAGTAIRHSIPSAATPTITGPITGPGSIALGIANYPLAPLGYTESEYFFSGTAVSYTNTSPLGSNGKWSVQPASSAAYKSRVVVVRPKNPAAFSGTVVVEWLNVSGGSDGSPDWSFAHDEMIRSGDAYIGVSAQSVGVASLIAQNPARYGSLVDPGDSYSYDMFSQAGMAVRTDTSTILRGLHPTTVIAAGESQSAIRMTTYVDAIAPLVNVFDSYLINSRTAGSAELSQAPQADIPTPPVVRIRTDLKVPVLTFLTETDVVGPLDYFPATQPNTNSFSLWEVAGTSHADTYLVTQAVNDNTSWASDFDQFASMTSPPSSVTIPPTFTLSCTVPFNAGEQHYVFQTALHDLVAWTRTGVPPRQMPRLAVNTSTTPPSYRLDRFGNVKGGIRTPAVDTPIATLSGLPPANASSFCILFGQTIPFTPAQISALYPSHADFVRAWDRSVQTDLQAGYLLPADAARLVDAVS
jgi:Alpha/beta hydrolase domain